MSFPILLLPWLLCSESHHDFPAASKQQVVAVKARPEDVSTVQPMGLSFPAANRPELLQMTV